MARMEAIDDTRPRAVRNARSAAFASRWIREKAMSPPRMRRPSWASPSVSERAIEDTPAMAATPSAMQARKTPNPRKPPRNSRRASRSVMGRIDGRGRGEAGRAPCMGVASSRGRIGRRLDPAGPQAHHAVAALGEVQVVGDEHQGRAALSFKPEQEPDDGVAGRLVEVAGRLVGEQERRIGHNRPGDRDALLFAAGQLRRIVMKPLAEPYGAQFA